MQKTKRRNKIIPFLEFVNKVIKHRYLIDRLKGKHEMSTISENNQVTYFTCDCLDFSHTIRVVEYKDTDFESIDVIAPIYVTSHGISKLDNYVIHIYLTYNNILSNIFYYLYHMLCFPISLYKILKNWYIPVIIQTDFINEEELQKFIDLTKKVYNFEIDTTVYEGICKVKPVQIHKKYFSIKDILVLALKGQIERFMQIEYWIDKSDNNQYLDIAGNHESMKTIRISKERH